MTIVVMGVSYKSAPADLLERCAVAAADLSPRLDELTAFPHLAEAVLISTPRRTEAYASADEPTAAADELRRFFSDSLSAGDGELDHAYVLVDQEAVGHLFRVACGLESELLGEMEILGQVRLGWDLARTQGNSGAMLNDLFRLAVGTGKRARSDTEIDGVTLAGRDELAPSARDSGPLADEVAQVEEMVAAAVERFGQRFGARVGSERLAGA